MLFAKAALALATITINTVIAGSLRCMQFHEKSNVELITEASIKERSADSALVDFKMMTEEDIAKLSTLGIKIGINSLYDNGQVWVGDSGQYTVEYHNESGEKLILLVWESPFVAATQPLITHSMAPGQVITLSFAPGLAGAWAALYPDTTISEGQVNNTVGEFVMTPIGIVDVSRRNNMLGNDMTIEAPTGCHSSMSHCVFICSPGLFTCGQAYQLHNCTGPGSQSGTDLSSNPAGGCSVGPGGKIKTTFW